jgi:limonene-1,2-epoxide hydrolase
LPPYSSLSATKHEVKILQVFEASFFKTTRKKSEAIDVSAKIMADIITVPYYIARIVTWTERIMVGYMDERQEVDSISTLVLFG